MAIRAQEETKSAGGLMAPSGAASDGLLPALRRHRVRLVLGALVGALALGVPRFLQPRTYTCTALLLFPSATRPGALKALAGGGSTDLPSIPLLEGLLSIPQPGSSAETASLILGSYRCTMALVRKFRLDQEIRKPPELARRWLRKELRRKTGDYGDLEIAFTYHKPDLARSVVQGAIRLLEDSVQEFRLDPAARSVAFIREQLAKSEAAFVRAGDALARFQRETGVMPPTDLVQMLGQRFSQVQGDLVAAEVEASAALSRARRLTDATEAMIRSAQDPSGNPESLLAQLYRVAVEKETKLSLLRRKYTDEHVEVVSARRELEESQRALQEEVRRQLAGVEQGANPILGSTIATAASAQAKVDGLRKAAAQLRAELARLPSRQARYAQLQLELEAQKARVLALRSELVKAELVARNQGPLFVVVDPPAVPDVPNPRGALRMSLIGFVLGLLGAALTLRPLRLFTRWLLTPQAGAASDVPTARVPQYNHYHGTGGRRAPYRARQRPPDNRG